MASPFDEPEFPWESEPTNTRELRADTYEQLQLIESQRKLQIAKRRKYAELRSVLVLKKEIAAIKLQTAEAQRLQADAELERAREMRLLENDKERAARAEQRLEESKQQTFQEMQGYIDVAKQAITRAEQAEGDALVEYNKRMLAESLQRLDEEEAEFRTCPECGEYMGVPEARERPRLLELQLPLRGIERVSREPAGERSTNRGQD